MFSGKQVTSQGIQIFIESTGASVPLQHRESGSRGTSYYKSVMSAGAKAKSVTNNLPLLSVL